MGGGGGGGVCAERIQHENDLQRRLSHTKRGQRRVPDASVLKDTSRKLGYSMSTHTSTNKEEKKGKTGTDSAAGSLTHTRNYRSSPKPVCIAQRIPPLEKDRIELAE